MPISNDEQAYKFHPNKIVHFGLACLSLLPPFPLLFLFLPNCSLLSHYPSPSFILLSRSCMAKIQWMVRGYILTWHAAGGVNHKRQLQGLTKFQIEKLRKLRVIHLSPNTVEEMLSGFNCQPGSFSVKTVNEESRFMRRFKSSVLVCACVRERDRDRIYLNSVFHQFYKCFSWKPNDV